MKRGPTTGRFIAWLNQPGKRAVRVTFLNGRIWFREKFSRYPKSVLLSDVLDLAHVETELPLQFKKPVKVGK